MATLRPSAFVAYDFSEEELALGTTFTHYQRLYLQTRRCEIAEQKLALRFDVNNPTAFAQEDAYLTGQLDMLTFLLDHEEEVHNALEQKLKEEQQR